MTPARFRREPVSKYKKLMASFFAVVAFSAVTPSWAQEARTHSDVNNGTDPTRLATTAGIQLQTTDFGSGLSADLFEAYYSIPIGSEKRMALEFRLTYASGPVDTSFGLGDASLKFTHVLDVNAKRGIAYTAELSFNTADRADLGAGQTVLELSGFYAKFLKNGAIFAPALVQTFGLGDEDPGRNPINTTTVDFYYVPKLANSNLFMTFDPALVYDWEWDKGFGSLSITFGVLTGKAFGGDSQIFIKPQVLAGANRPADWSLQVGYKVIGI